MSVRASSSGSLTRMPGHVHGDVADPDDRHRLGVQLERARVHVGVAAVPVDELGGRVAARQVLTVDAASAGPASRRSRR